MKHISSAIVLMMVLCILMGMVACGDKRETEEIYTEVDYATLDLDAYVKLGQYKGLELTVSPISVNMSEIEDALQAMIDKETTFEEYSEPVTDRLTEAGDYVEINFKAYFDGQLYKDGSADGVAILLADNNGFFEWLDDDLYGIMPGTTVETIGVLPEESYYGDYAGREGAFVITLVSIKAHYTIPELTDAFIAERTEYDTVEAYRKAMYDTLLEEATETAEAERLSLMWETVLENAEILEYPEQQLMYYYTVYRSNIEAEADIYGHTYEEHLEAIGLTDEDLTEGAKSLVLKELVFYAIVKAEGFSISDAEYDDGVVRYAEQQGMTVEQLEASYDKAYITDNLLWDKVMYALRDMTTFITDNKLSTAGKTLGGLR